MYACQGSRSMTLGHFIDQESESVRCRNGYFDSLSSETENDLLFANSWFSGVKSDENLFFSPERLMTV